MKSGEPKGIQASHKKNLHLATYHCAWWKLQTHIQQGAQVALPRLHHAILCRKSTNGSKPDSFFRNIFVERKLGFWAGGLNNFGTSDLINVISCSKTQLDGGIPTPLKNARSSVGRIIHSQWIWKSKKWSKPPSSQLSRKRKNISQDVSIECLRLNYYDYLMSAITMNDSFHRPLDAIRDRSTPRITWRSPLTMTRNSCASENIFTYPLPNASTGPTCTFHPVKLPERSRMV